MTKFSLLILSVALGAFGCGGGSTSISMDAGADSALDGGAGDPEIPQGGQALTDFLNNGDYSSWAAEGSVHPTSAPHGNATRVFLSPGLAAALADSQTSFPEGVGAVKEIYDSGMSLIGYAVSLKVASEGDKDDWYWYETLNSVTLADEVGITVCTSCHSDGTDYLRTVSL